MRSRKLNLSRGGIIGVVAGVILAAAVQYFAFAGAQFSYTGGRAILIICVFSGYAIGESVFRRMTLSKPLYNHPLQWTGREGKL